jgi:hypothetical protein
VLYTGLFVPNTIFTSFDVRVDWLLVRSVSDIPDPKPRNPCLFHRLELTTISNPYSRQNTANLLRAILASIAALALVVVNDLLNWSLGGA